MTPYGGKRIHMRVGRAKCSKKQCFQFGINISTVKSPIWLQKSEACCIRYSLYSVWIDITGILE
jgi:hypothetical protein